MIETGRYGTINELAAAEKINSSYVSRVLRLTLLAPDIVEVILDGRQPESINLPALMEPFPTEWTAHAQLDYLGSWPAEDERIGQGADIYKCLAIGAKPSTAGNR